MNPDPFGDFDDDGDIDLVDVAGLQNCFADSDPIVGACERLDRQPDGLVELTDAGAFLARLTGPR